MRQRSCILFIAFLFFSAAFARAAETPIPPAPASWITDTAGFLSPPAALSLDAQLGAYERSAGHQLFVYIGKTTGGVPIEDWAVRAFAAWKVGRKGLDDGLVLFIMTEDRRLRIEAGYGLEGQVTDVIATRIINDLITPRIQAGDHDGAVLAGMNAVAQVVSGQGLSALPTAQRSQHPSGRRALGMGQMILIGLGVLLFLILLVTNPSLAIYLIASILSGNRGGGYSDGGGFGGGGGGRSGGGGASGSW